MAAKATQGKSWARSISFNPSPEQVCEAIAWVNDHAYNPNGIVS